MYLVLITLINPKPSPVKTDDFYGFINNFVTCNFNRTSFGEILFLEILKNIHVLIDSCCILPIAQFCEYYQENAWSCRF